MKLSPDQPSALTALDRPNCSIGRWRIDWYRLVQKGPLLLNFQALSVTPLFTTSRLIG
jgi:hypothetical protein